MARYVDAHLAPIYLNTVACEQIKRMPTANVVEVKHGGWSRHNLKCSVCGKTNPTVFLDEYSVEYRAKFLDYCPHCGAKMDGDYV